MCGISGFIEFGGASAEALYHTVAGMSDALRHRGPDGAGIWVDGPSGVALGHRRLSVVDLSRLGRQPMESDCGRYILTFNGEIYNYGILRRQLQDLGHAFRGSSDTEVLLAAIAEWGFEAALNRAVGMFAAAVWDKRARLLSLGRDRIGEKPLYYAHTGRAFLFGSELSALRAHPADLGELDRGSLALYLRFAYIPAPHSIWSRVSKLEPGSILTVDADGAMQPARQYWSCQAVYQDGLVNPLRCRPEEAVEQLESLLEKAVDQQTNADVPVGAFLSGGIDSATIVALMCRRASDVRTFTLGFAEESYDESGHARAVASYLGTTHTELRVTPSEAMDVIPRLPSLYGEPFADSSQIPTYLVSQLARRQVTVALSGDGGDELFGGYNRYSWADSIWRRIGRFPRALRLALSRGLARLPIATVDRATAGLQPFLPRRLRVRHPGDKLHKLAHLLSAADQDRLYQGLVSQWRAPAELLSGVTEPLTLVTMNRRLLPEAEFQHRMMLLDSLTYLPDDILVKLDRASMGVSLEARSPFLDHRIVEFACRLPLHMKIRGNEGKWALRQVLYRSVPKALVDRPKAGFAIPLHSWVRGPLREWAEDLLSERRLRSDGIFQVGPIRAKWREHLASTHNWIGPLWTILMFQSWHAQQRRSPDTQARVACHPGGTN